MGRRPGPQPHLRKASDLNCDHCGSTFYRSPANRNKRGPGSYCSRVCMGKAYEGRAVGEKSPRWKGTETRPCNFCASPVTRPAWTWNNRKNTFCDRSCFSRWKSDNWTGDANPAWAGGKFLYYGANWKRQQREARRRDGHRCQLCDVHESELRRALDVHHIRPFRFYGLENYRDANRLSNLISLCDRCHTHVERFCRDGDFSDWPALLAVLS